MTTKIPNIIRVIIISLISSCFCFSCVEDYWPELKADDQNLLVVDGKITNKPGPYKVVLSRSSNIQKQFEYIPETNAIVSITDEQGNSETLTEVEDGIYLTSQGGIQGVIGNKYKISIQTSDGEKYESEFDEIRETVPIENLKAAIETNEIFNENELIEEPGIQFYVEPEISSENPKYLYWGLEETYEYHARYRTYYELNKGDSRDIYSLNDLRELKDTEKRYYCYKTNHLKDIFTYNGEFLSEGSRKVPLSFLAFGTSKADFRYCLTVTQYTISEQAHLFLKSMKELNKDDGNLHSKQPYQVFGNIKNIENENETVLGFFFVAGASESERILTEAPPQYIEYQEPLCTLIFDDIFETLRKIDEESLPVYVTLVDEREGGGESMISAFPALLLYTPECIDCTVKGGVVIKPDYWDNSFIYELEED